MIIDVMYTSQGKFGLHGQGKIHVTETAIVLDGEYLRIAMPTWALAFGGALFTVLYPLISDHSFRTIPYSRIFELKDGRFIKNSISLVFLSSAGKKETITFALMKKPERPVAQELAMSTIRSFHQETRSLMGAAMCSQTI